jgi:hypothetical protein
MPEAPAAPISLTAIPEATPAGKVPHEIADRRIIKNNITSKPKSSKLGATLKVEYT